MSIYAVVDGRLYDPNELWHYGVKGQKWGVRRYQNADGTLTAEGKKRAKAEYKADNKEAFERGKNATVYGHAAARSMSRTARLENKLEKRYEKDPGGIKSGTQRLQKKWAASAKTTQQLTEQYVKYKEEAEDHCQRLIDKYGSEAVSSIKYKDIKLAKSKYSPDSFKTMNERTNDLSDYARAGLLTASSVGLSTMMGVPFYMIYYPNSTAAKAADLESGMYSQNKQSGKKTQSTVIQPTETSNTKTQTSQRATRKSNPTPEESGRKPVTTVSESLKSKTPYFALSDDERISIDRDYEDRRQTLINKRDNTSSSSERQRIVDQLDQLENDYLDIVERDW